MPRKKAIVEENTEECNLDNETMDTHEILRQSFKVPMSKAVAKNQKKTVSTPKIYKCDVCGKESKDNAVHRNHVAIHSDSKPYQCPQCPCRFKVKKYVSRHVNRVHSDVRKLSCAQCGNKYSWHAQLKAHMMVHTGEKPLKCKVCGKGFRVHYSLKTHMLIHTDEKPFACSFCAYRCRDSSTLRKHQRRHMELDTLYQCRQCHVLVRSKAQLKLHVAEVHLGLDVKRFTCDVCGKAYKIKSVLAKHIQVIHSRPPAPPPETEDEEDEHFKPKKKHVRKLRLPCPHCERVFDRRGRFASHLQRHKPRTSVRCPQCQMCFLNTSYLNLHLRRVHHAAPAETFECAACAHVCGSKEEMREHLQSEHADNTAAEVAEADPANSKCGEDRACSECGRRFRSATLLARHRRTRHQRRSSPPALDFQVEVKQEPIETEDAFAELDLFEVDKQEIEDHVRSAALSEARAEIARQLSSRFSSLSRVPERLFDEHFIEVVNKRDPDPGVKKYYTKKNVENIVDLDPSQQSSQEGPVVKKSNSKRKKNAKRLKQIDKAVSQDQSEQLNSISQDQSEQLNSISQDQSEQLNSVNQDQSEESDPVSEDESEESDTEYQPKGLSKDVIHNILSGPVVRKSQRAKKVKRLKDMDYAVDQNQSEQSTAVNQEEPEQSTTVNQNQSEQLDSVSQDLPERLSKKAKSKSKSPKKAARAQTKSKKKKKHKSPQKDKKAKEPKQKKVKRMAPGKPGQTMIRLNIELEQCYVCLKVFKTKQELLNHCQEHFDICTERTLKKCPLCEFVTEGDLRRHIHLIHKLDIPMFHSFKENPTTGTQYTFNLRNNQNDVVKEIEVIPSVKRLNHLAAMKLDRQKREYRDKVVTKTKLVKKGKEWIVEQEPIDIQGKLPKFDDEEYIQAGVCESDDYIKKLKKMYQHSKKVKKEMMFPCDTCQKVCRTVSALVLHRRRHDPNAKPFKPKIWKHKLSQKDLEELNKREPKTKTIDRNKPRPIVSRHKCDPKLKDFYMNNIRGGDIEFWQFLKIFNKIAKDNVKDFNDLNNKDEYAMHRIENPTDEVVTQNESTKVVKPLKPRLKPKGKFIRVVRLSKIEYLRRRRLKEKLREKIKADSGVQISCEC